MADVELPKVHTHVECLKGVTGRVRFDIGTTPVAVVEVHDGEVELHRAEGAADAVARCDSKQTLLSVIENGAINPIVAWLQNRLEFAGNRELAVRVILGLRGTRLIAEAR